jgi:hypothetical protein
MAIFSLITAPDEYVYITILDYWIYFKKWCLRGWINEIFPAGQFGK